MINSDWIRTTMPKINKNMCAPVLPLLLLLITVISSHSTTGASSPGYGRSRLAFSLPQETISSSRENLLSYARQLNSDAGPFLNDDAAVRKLKGLVAELEAVCDAPGLTGLTGDWQLLCTTDAAERNTQRKGSFPLPGFVQDRLQQNVQKSVRVVQRIRSNDSDDKIDRVDNVIEITPLSSLSDLIPNSIYDNVNINPLEVSKTKVALVHSAEVMSISPVLRTKIALKSIILTIAGTSQFLEPDGDDVLGLNLPFGDFLNFGSFDTTYLDDELRISRGKQGPIDQLRVFVRESPAAAVSNYTDDAVTAVE